MQKPSTRPDFLVVSTPYLYGYRIEQYIGPIYRWTSGAGGVVTDWLAKFSSFFGTRSKAYEQNFQEYIDKAINGLIADAIERGANAIIDLAPEVTAMPGDSSMLLILLHGTMVYAVPDTDVKYPSRDAISQPRDLILGSHAKQPDAADGLSPEGLSMRDGKYSLMPTSSGPDRSLSD